MYKLLPFYFLFVQLLPFYFLFVLGNTMENQLKAVLQAKNDAGQGHTKQHGHNQVSGQEPKQELIDN